MRVLLVGRHHGHQIRGATIATHGLARVLQQRGHHVTLLHSAKPEVRRQLPSVDMRYWRSERKSLYPLLYATHSLRDIDVVHANDESSAFFSLRGRYLGAPVAAHMHAPRVHPESFWRAGWRWRYIEIGVRCAPIIITPSEWLANELAERYQRDRRDFRVIPCGIGDHWFETPSRPGERKPRVALVNMKGVDVALRAFARIAGQVDAELWLYGTHRDPAALEKLAGELRIGERTHFAGFVANEALPAQLAGARLLVHPTESESFGQVLAEAAALGIPSVATRVNATPEVIEHGATGYLCTPGEVDDFAARMLQILQRPELARSLGAAAQRRARARWRWDSVAGQLENEVYLPLTAT